MTTQRRIQKGPLMGALAIIIPAGTFMWFVGVSLQSTLAFAAVMLASGFAWGAYAGSTAPRSARLRPGPRPGVRSDVAQLSWALRDRDAHVSDPGLKRIRAYARHRLARQGLDLDEPADQERIHALLGDHAYALVTRKGGVRPSLGGVERCLDALDALASPARRTADTPKEGRSVP